MSLALLLLYAAAASSAGIPPLAQGRGLVAVAKPAAPVAMLNNAEGKKLYRQGRFAEARERYRAALAADPDFLSAQLNLACSLAREGSFAEAAEEISRLLHIAFVPWQREIKEAADLGILEGQESYTKVQSTMAEEARVWGELVLPGVLFLARVKPPVKVAGEGALLLSLNQEIFAWRAETGRYLQVTAEDGHVIGFVRSDNRRRVAYVLGGKLVHEPGRPDRLRGLSVRVLDIPTMSVSPSFAIPGDVTVVAMSFSASPEIRRTSEDGSISTWRLGEIGWEPIGALRQSREALAIDAGGVKPVARLQGGRLELTCARTASGLWQVEVRRANASPFHLDARFGAGLGGLPFPRATASK
ncbi:MAG: tetratricopeptide repeat protein [Polyangia bacterium]